MSGPEIVLNKLKTEPTLADLLNVWKRDSMLSINCHAIGNVESFDATKQTIQATINYIPTVFRLDQKSGQYTAKPLPYPPLVDVPVIILGGGSGNLTMPIQKGDTCLLLFNDRAIDTWLSSGQITSLPSPRLHSISDAIALVGLHSFQASVQNYDTSRVKLSNGSTFVALGPSLIEINNAANHSLGGILTQLMTNLTSLATALQANPSVETAAAAAGAALVTSTTSLQTLINGLLS